jgi:hypothetical protein
VKWLLNLAYMTTGGYPSRVPPVHLIPPSALTSTDTVGRFVDVAPRAGLTSFASAGGVIVDDFDNDGRLDVVTSSFNSCESMHFFHRDADGRFSEQATKAGLSDQLGGLNILQTDYNNDGCLDILLLRGGWEMAQRKSLLRNNCDGTFTDVTVASGLARPATSTQTAAWTDINNDGFLDLFVGNEESAAQLFLNKGDGTFEDIAHAAGVDRTAFTKGVAAADFDNDGWPDLYVSNLGGRNFLYHNNHDGTFTELGNAAGVPGAGQGFATWFFDYDNDGWPDLFVTSYFTSVDESVRTYLGLAHNAGTLKLYRNLGDGSFQDVTRQVGLDKVYMPMGANFGDVDNDGFLDIYLGTGNPSYGSLIPSVLLHSQGGRSFADVTESSGTGELHKGHGVAFADLDNDGNDEIVFEVGGATPGDAHALRLFHNPGRGADRCHHRRCRSWNASHPSNRRQRWILRRLASGAAYRPRSRGAHRLGRCLVANEQHAPAFHRHRQEPVDRNQGICSGLGRPGTSAPLPRHGDECAARRCSVATVGVGSLSPRVFCWRVDPN